MKSLFVTEVYPWPPRDGYRMRLSNLIESLVSLGPVDVLCTDPREAAWPEPPEGVTVIPIPEGAQLSVTSWLPAWVRSDLPRRVIWRDFEPVRSAAPAKLDGPYDVAVFGHLETYVGLGDIVDGPSIVDFDNLENLSMRSQRAAGPDIYPHMGAAAQAKAMLRWGARSSIDLVDQRRWDKAQKQVAADVDRVLVCSDLDVRRSGCANAVSVPNGYEAPASSAQRRGGALVDPQLMFVGSMGYPPNADAARWFSTEVFPHIRAELPQATLRLVGRNPESIADLSSLEGVEVVGQVEDIGDELKAADIAVVPIRVGAGTRLKVLEAMAYRLPIASTTLGSEGIDLHHEVGAMLVDDPNELASACIRLAAEPDLRDRLTSDAFDLYTRSYQWSSIRDEFATLAFEVASRPKG